jgi:hypothetical protein
MFENRVLRRLFRLKREATGENYTMRSFITYAPCQK